MVYKDKNGVEIKEGMLIQHDEGDLERVYPCGDGDLGVSATNPEYLKTHPDAEEEFYPLSNFCLSEWEIVPEAGEKAGTES